MSKNKRIRDLVLGKFRPTSAAGRAAALLYALAPRPVSLRKIKKINRRVNMRGRVLAIGRILRREAIGVVQVDNHRNTVRLLLKKAA